MCLRFPEAVGEVKEVRLFDAEAEKYSGSEYCLVHVASMTATTNQTCDLFVVCCPLSHDICHCVICTLHSDSSENYEMVTT